MYQFITNIKGPMVQVRHVLYRLGPGEWDSAGFCDCGSDCIDRAARRLRILNSSDSVVVVDGAQERLCPPDLLDHKTEASTQTKVPSRRPCLGLDPTSIWVGILVGLAYSTCLYLM